MAGLGVPRRGLAALGIAAAVSLGAKASRQGAVSETTGRSGPQPWTVLPPTPRLPDAAVQRISMINGIRLFSAELGAGETVIFLHGGLANANYWGHQLTLVSAGCHVVALDTRGHGRSSLGDARLSYELLASDVVAYMDARRIDKASIVGWSDGAITGLQLAMVQPKRIAKLFAFGANYNLTGLWPNGPHSATFTAYTARCRQEYRMLAADPDGYWRLLSGLNAMWQSEPNYHEAELARITCLAAIVAADHDEIIPAQHTRRLAAAIPSSVLLTEVRVSHFAMLQDPPQFAADLLRFLG